MTSIPQGLSQLLRGTITSDEDQHARQIREALVRQIFPDLSLQEQLEIANATELDAMIRNIRTRFGDDAGSDEYVQEMAKRIITVLRRAEGGEFDKDSPTTPPTPKFP